MNEEFLLLIFLYMSMYALVLLVDHPPYEPPKLLAISSGPTSSTRVSLKQYHRPWSKFLM